MTGKSLAMAIRQVTAGFTAVKNGQNTGKTVFFQKK
jgi:hypothetical protein